MKSYFHLIAIVATVLAFPSTVLAATGRAPSGPPAWQIFVVTGLVYAAVSLAMRTRMKLVIAFRKLWNVILLVSFLVVGVTGAATALYSQFGWMWLVGLNDYDLHVIFGLVMTAVALFHTLWHWRYFLSILKRPSA